MLTGGFFYGIWPNERSYPKSTSVKIYIILVISYLLVACGPQKAPMSQKTDIWLRDGENVRLWQTEYKNRYGKIIRSIYYEKNNRIESETTYTYDSLQRLVAQTTAFYGENPHTQKENFLYKNNLLIIKKLNYSNSFINFEYKYFGNKIIEEKATGIFSGLCCYFHNSQDSVVLREFWDIERKHKKAWQSISYEKDRTTTSFFDSLRGLYKKEIKIYKNSKLHKYLLYNSIDNKFFLIEEKIYIYNNQQISRILVHRPAHTDWCGSPFQDQNQSYIYFYSQKHAIIMAN